MNGTELFHKDGRSAGVWYCEKCKYVKRTQAEADECCKQWVCGKCGKESGQFRTICDECWRAEHRRKEDATLAAATLLPDYDGWVWSHEVSGYQDGYFPSAQDLAEHCQENPGDDEDEDKPYIPEFAHTCNTRTFSLDLSSAIESMCEEGYDEMEEHLSGVEELQIAVDAFNVLNAAALTVYEADMKHKVAIRP